MTHLPLSYDFLSKRLIPIKLDCWLSIGCAARFLEAELPGYIRMAKPLNTKLTNDMIPCLHSCIKSSMSQYEVLQPPMDPRHHVTNIRRYWFLVRKNARYIVCCKKWHVWNVNINLLSFTRSFVCRVQRLPTVNIWWIDVNRFRVSLTFWNITVLTIVYNMRDCFSKLIYWKLFFCLFGQNW